MKSKILFKEEQTFMGTWAWYLVLGICLLTLGGIVLNLIQDQNTDSFVGLIIGSTVCGAIVMLFVYSKLEVSIDQSNIYYRYFPFVAKEKKLSKGDIKEVYVREYRPVMEYGGWGYRISMGNGKALNVSGDIGLQLVLKDGKRLLLGTKKKDALERAIQKLKENWELDA